MESSDRPSFLPHKRKANDVELEEEANLRPAFGFKKFAPPSSRSPSPSSSTKTMNRPSWRNQNTLSSHSGSKNPAPSSGGNSFAARMMAKMGYVEGQGLGASKQGIVNPVEHVLRPQGAGLGAVKEMSQQAKDEAKRQAARKGETVDDSSDEEQQRIRRRKERRRLENESGSGTSTPGGVPRRRYRTAREYEAEMLGREPPNVLKSLIDMTGKEQKLLTSTAGLMTSTDFISLDDDENYKSLRKARNELVIPDEWRTVSEQEDDIEAEENRAREKLESRRRKLERLESLGTAAQALENISLEDSLDQRWEQVTEQLESIEAQYNDIADDFSLSKIAVAAVQPLFRQSMEDWEPLKRPDYLVSTIKKLQNMMKSDEDEDEDEDDETDLLQVAPGQSSTLYDTLFFTFWLPRVRTALVNDWNVHDSASATALIDSWKDLLPEAVLSNVLDQVIVPKLSTAIKSWNPKRSSRQGGGTSEQFPWFIFDWLRYLADHHMDPRASSGLLSEVRRKFRSVLGKWDLRKGLIGDIDMWKDTLGSEFDHSLRNHLLPRLSRYLREHFSVDPQAQEMTVFENVMKWKPYYKPKVFALLLCTEFFPKWHAILHQWLTSDPNYDEIAQWFTWWKSQVPEDLNAMDDVAEEWNRGLELMNQALDLGDKAKTDLPLPNGKDQHGLLKEEIRGKQHVLKEPPSKPSNRSRHVEAPSFKDIVEEWCAEEGLLMVPLREAHVQTGLPLFRITASATGRGGVQAYLKGDVVWAQNRRSKDVWEPVGLDSTLVTRAEGK